MAGPLADARRSRDAAVEDARTVFSGRVEEAIQAYGPAATVYDAARETLRALRTEFEVYRIVLEAADIAAADAETAISAAVRNGTGRSRDLAELQARADTARASYEDADRAYEEAVRARPKRVEPRKTGSENFGRFLDSLNSLAAGDRAGAERSAEEMGRAREAALRDAEAANAAAKAAYDDAVAAAGETRDAAYAAYRSAAGAVQRAAAEAAGARADRERAAESYETALAARRAAFVNASRVTRVFEAEEVDEVERVVMAGALAAIAELETASLAGITKGEALVAIELALGAYADPGLAALRPLDGLEAARAAAAEAARAALMDLETAEARNEERADQAREVIRRVMSTYVSAVDAADNALDDALVASFRRTRPGDRKGVEMRTAAASAYRRAFESALASRRQAIVQAFPNVKVRAPGHPALPSLESAWSTRVVASVTEYRKQRAATDGSYGGAIVVALTTDTGALAADARSAAAARDAARAAYDEAFAVARAAIAFDERARARLPALEADVRSGVVAAGRAAVSVKDSPDAVVRKNRGGGQ